MDLKPHFGQSTLTDPTLSAVRAGPAEIVGGGLKYTSRNPGLNVPEGTSDTTCMYGAPQTTLLLVRLTSFVDYFTEK